MNALFENNLINFIVLAVLLGILWQRVMPGVFAARKERIERDLTEAKRIQREGEEFYEQQKVRIANAEKEAELILVDAKRVAEQMKEQITQQTKKDAEDLEKKITQQIATQRQMVITELRSQAATVAVRIAEASLPGAITGKVKQGLQDRFIKQLDSVGSNT